MNDLNAKADENIANIGNIQKVIQIIWLNVLIDLHHSANHSRSIAPVCNWVYYYPVCFQEDEKET